MIIHLIISIIVLWIIYAPIHIYRGLIIKTRLIKLFFRFYIVLAIVYIISSIYLIYKIYEQQQIIKELSL